ncbi:MAG: cytidine deaminase [Elusimicrobia bacterium]|nr:cytidine deaminase [Elusimicrobiota bacterium]
MSIAGAIEKKLVSAAVRAGKNAYCPYSRYRVGAAVLGSSGKIYTGCNVENISFGLTNCAERTAIFSGISAGEKKFKAMAVAAMSARSCGACRQVMVEFFPQNAPVILININRGGKVSKITRQTLGELIPFSFNPAEIRF